MNLSIVVLTWNDWKSTIDCFKVSLKVTIIIMM